MGIGIKGEKGEPGAIGPGQGSGVFIPGPKGDKVRSRLPSLPVNLYARFNL